MAKKSKSPLTEAKNKAWSMFSKYIRLSYADKDGYCTCVTCGKKIHWKTDAQAGHFVGSRNNSVLLNEDLVYPQCVGCNVYLMGNLYHYTKYMLSLGFTMEELDKFHALKLATKKMSIQDWEEKYQEYKDKFEDLQTGREL